MRQISKWEETFEKWSAAFRGGVRNHERPGLSSFSKSGYSGLIYSCRNPVSLTCSSLRGKKSSASTAVYQPPVSAFWKASLSWYSDVRDTALQISKPQSPSACLHAFDRALKTTVNSQQLTCAPEWFPGVSKIHGFPARQGILQRMRTCKRRTVIGYSLKYFR